MKLRRAFLDFETFWSREHTLKKMDPIQYVLHPETEIISCAIQIDDYPVDVIFGEREVIRTLQRLDWSTIMAIGHNMSGFDALLLAWRLKVRPALYACTLSMARPIYGKVCSLSLETLLRHTGLGSKDNTALVQTMGKHLEDFTAQELADMEVYNKEDTLGCHKLFDHLRPFFSAEEMFHMDCNIRMMTDPQFEVDRGLLETAQSIERDRKRQALLDVAKMLRARDEPTAVDVTDGPEYTDTFWESDEETITEFVRSELASAPKFSALLESRGVEVPMKQSPTNPDKLTPALAKTDEAFQALADHEDPLVAAAARARLAVKSTLLETRIQTFLDTSAAVDGRLPVPLRYCGADTTGRDSGWLYNPQNLPRIGSSPKPSDALRRCLRAPKGFVVGVADQSGIELRVNHTLWKEPDTMAAYAASPTADLYKDLAAWYYQIPQDQVEKPQRQMGKVMHLGLGFGAGGKTFQRIARLMGNITLSEAEASNAVTGWRTRYSRIATGWKTCGEALNLIAQGVRADVDPWGMVTTEAGGLRLPSGRMIRYPALEYVDEGQKWPDGRSKKSWRYGVGRHRAYLTGPKVDENCIAAGTLVLTDRGWVAIEEVRASDRVHDGKEFVRHGGLVFRGVQPCVIVDGVGMTPDHEVLTDDGWTPAGQIPRPYRPDLRHVDGAEYCRPGRQEAPHTVDVSLHLRVDNYAPRRASDPRTEEGRRAELWVCHKAAHRPQQHDAWAFSPPGVCSLGVHESPLSQAVAPGVQKLRGPWYHGVRSLGQVIRGVLGRHAGWLRAGPGSGSARQQQWVRTRQLPVGYSAPELAEQARQSYAGRRAGAKSRDGHKPDNAVLPTEERMAAGQTADSTRIRKPVYDILNCGPRTRFVVRGDAGPFIVHNCVQALARDSVFEAALRFFKLSRMRPVMRVHDELIYVFPKSEAQSLLDELQKILRSPPSWWPALITWSEGDLAETYGDAK